MKIGCWEVPKPTYPFLLWLAEWKAPAPLKHAQVRMLYARNISTCIFVKGPAQIGAFTESTAQCSGIVLIFSQVEHHFPIDLPIMLPGRGWLFEGSSAWELKFGVTMSWSLRQSFASTMVSPRFFKSVHFIQPLGDCLKWGGPPKLWCPAMHKMSNFVVQFFLALSICQCTNCPSS